LRDDAQALAEVIAARPPGLVAATKAALWHALEVGVSEAERHAVFVPAE
jgi:enoyl-CoA hydratase/carnithine racemase